LQPAAISRKSTRRANRENEPNPLPQAATGCLRRSMVRRGSPVRVRKRALQSTCKNRPFSSLTRRPVSGRGRPWKALWKTQLRSRSRRRTSRGRSFPSVSPSLAIALRPRRPRASCRVIRLAWRPDQGHGHGHVQNGCGPASPFWPVVLGRISFAASRARADARDLGGVRRQPFGELARTA
jgi:hypothetical protein